MGETELIEPCLEYACDDKDTASEKTILANGGVYEKTIDVDGSRMKRFWISTGL